MFVCVFMSERLLLRLLQTGRKQERCGEEGDGTGELRQEFRATKGYRHCGFSATEKNLIIICSGWQFGIWLVEIFSAVFNSCCTFLG